MIKLKSYTELVAARIGLNMITKITAPIDNINCYLN
jgi:hypothetical protein